LFTGEGKSQKDVGISQKKGKIKRKRKVIQLPEQEFVAVQDAFMTDVTNEERKQEVLTIFYGNHMYKGVLREDGSRDIVSKRRIKNA